METESRGEVTSPRSPGSEEAKTGVPLPIAPGRDSQGAGGPRPSRSLETHRLTCVLRGQADTPWDWPGSWRQQHRYHLDPIWKGGRGFWKGHGGGGGSHEAPGNLSPPCAAGAPPRPLTSAPHLSCSPQWALQELLADQNPEAFPGWRPSSPRGAEAERARPTRSPLGEPHPLPGQHRPPLPGALRGACVRWESEGLFIVST